MKRNESSHCPLLFQIELFQKMFKPLNVKGKIKIVYRPSEGRVYSHDDIKSERLLQRLSVSKPAVWIQK